MDNREVKLEKKLSIVNVWALAFGCIIGWSAFVLPGTSFLKNAGTLGTAIGMFVAALIMIIISVNYNYMINKYPVAGGEFVYSNKAFGKTGGFVCSWFLGLSYLALVPLNASGLALIVRTLFGDALQFGFSYRLAGYDVYLGEILLAVIAIVLFGILCIRGVKFTGVFQTVITALLAGGVLVVGLAAIFSSKTSASNLLPLFSPDKAPIAGIIGVLAIAPYAFVGFDTIPQSAEEFNFSPKKTMGILVIAIFFGASVYVGLNTIAASVLPEGYNNWTDYIGNLDNLSGLVATPTFYAAKELLGVPGIVAIGLAVLAALTSGVVGFYMATSRLLYSVSREGMLPEWFGKINEKYKTPANAIVFVMLVSLVAAFFGRNTLVWVVDMSSLGAAIGYGFTSAAAFKFALKDKKIGVMITGIIGTLFAIVCAVILLVPIKGLNCSLGKEPYICLLVWVVMGIGFFVYMRNKRK